MNILFGRAGLALTFGQQHHLSLGDALWMNVFRQYPQHDFYIVSPHNIDRLKNYDVPPNAHFIPQSIYPKNVEVKEMKYIMVEYLKSLNIKFDFGIMYYSTCVDLACTYNNFTFKSKYCNIGLYSIQRLGVPYIIYNDDAGAFKYGLPYDMRSPKVIVSQFNGKIRKLTVVDGDALADRMRAGELWKPLREEVEQMYEEVKCVYGDCEKVPLIEKGKKVDFRNLPKTGGWLLGARLTPVRVKMYNEWFGDNTPFKSQIPLYINGEMISESKDLQLPTEKKSFAEMQDELWNARYAFVCQNSNIKRFVTGKFWDMIYYGIIPFFDKNTYDTQNLLNAPEICRVDNPQELYERVQMLDNDEELYRKTLNELYELLKDEYFDPVYMVHKIFDKYLNVEKVEDINFD